MSTRSDIFFKIYIRCCRLFKASFTEIDSFVASNPIEPLSFGRMQVATLPRRDLLVLALNRDGKVELKNAAFFDLNANGFHEFTRWIDKTYAFLLLDKHFNGKADNGGSRRLP